MVSLQAVAGISAVALGMVLTPGPNMIYLVSRSVTQGHRAGLVSLAGVAAGYLVYLVLAAAGLVAVLTLVPAVYLAIKFAGAAYLLWLAWSAVRPGGVSAFAPKDLPPDPPRRLFAMGLVTNLLNPKIAVLYVSLLPQFVDPRQGHLAEQSFLLGLAQITVSLSVNALIVMSAGTVSSFLTRRPTWLRTQRYVMGTVLAGMAVRIATAPDR
jgi:threonine/homoserine/homoserine lactone efflux protein